MNEQEAVREALTVAKRMHNLELNDYKESMKMQRIFCFAGGMFAGMALHVILYIIFQ